MGNSSQAELTFDGSNLDLTLSSGYLALDGGGLLVDQHVGIGNDSSIHPSIALYVREDFDDDTFATGLYIVAENVSNAAATFYGQFIQVLNSTSSGHDTIGGLNIYASSSNNSGATVNDIKGARIGCGLTGDNSVINQMIAADVNLSSGFSMVDSTAITAIAVRAWLLDAGSGDLTIDDGYGVLVKTPSFNPTGETDNLYGVYVEDQSTVGFNTHYNFYSAGANSENFFAGNVTINGDQTVNGETTINDSITINAETTLNDTLLAKEGIEVGEENASDGVITLFGSTVTAGGNIVLETAADAAIDEFQISVMNNNLRIGTPATPEYGIEYVGLEDRWIIRGTDGTAVTALTVEGSITCDDLFASANSIRAGNAVLSSPGGDDLALSVNGVEYLNLAPITQTLGVSTATSQLWMSESVGGLIYGYVGGTLMLAMGGTTQSIQLGDLANTNLLLNSNANIATLEAANKTALVATGNAGVDLYYNNTKVFETQQDGILVDTNCSIKMSGSVLEILNLGHGQEIQLKAENLAGTPTLMIGAIPDGAASLYYAGDVKLATDSTGVIATGDVVADAFIGDGSQLTGLPAASSISEGNSNVTVTDTGTGNISTTVDGTLIQYLEDGQQIYGGSGDTQIVLNQDGNWMSMGVGSTGIVTFLQTSQTIGIFNDSRLVVDQAGNKVDLYGGNVLAASFADDGVTITGPLYAGGIQQDDSYVQVVDDGTDAGYIEIVADGEQVGYFDAESNSIRIGKESGAFKTTLTDTSAKITLNTTDVIQANSDQVRLGASSTDFVVDHVSDYFSGRINGTSVLSIADSSQRIGKVAGGYIVAGASAADLYYSGNKKFETTTDGAKVTGDLEITGNLKGGFTVQRVYGDYTAEDGDVILVDGTAEVTITLTESTDAHIVVKSLQDDTVNVVGATGDVDDQPEFELTAKYWSGTFVCDGTDWFVI